MNMSPEYRHLEHATDAAFMREFFASCLDHLDADASDLVSCNVPRVFPRKDGTFVIQYELQLKSRHRQSASRLLLCGLLPKSPDEARITSAGYDIEKCLTCPEIGLIVPVFPFDPGLPSLVDLWDIEKAAARIARLPSARDGWHFDGTVVSREVLGYRLERRCSLSYLCSRQSASGRASSMFELVAKIESPKRIARALRTMEELAQSGFAQSNTIDGAPLPTVLGADVDGGIMLMEKVPASSLHSLLSHADFSEACAAAGRVLRRFHKLPGQFEQAMPHTVDVELAGLGSAVQLLCTLFPDCASRVEMAYHMLAAHAVLDPSSDEVGLVHRDFHDKQVLFTKGRTTLLDYDNASPGDPAQDVGNFLAHLDLRRLQHPEAGSQLTSAGEMFMESYGRGDEPFARRVDWWRAATLMRLASLYALRPRWRHLTPELAEQCRLRVDTREHATKGV